MGFFDGHVERRTAKNRFFRQLDALIDWAPIEKELKRVYKKGQKERGTKAYGPLLLFKMQLVSVWYGLSDVQVEEMANENLSVMRFLGLSLEDAVPDHSTLSRFRSDLVAKKAYDRILKKVNAQLSSHRLIVRNGSAKVDASLTESPFSPKGATTYEMAVDRQEDERGDGELEKEDTYHMEKKEEQPGADNQARWVKKGGKSVYGYKKHMATDDNGMVLGVHTVPANEHDSKGLEPLIKKIPRTQRKEVMADKGYKSRANDEMLRENGSRSRIMHKGYRNTPLTKWQTRYNKAISKTRWVVERTFGSLKRWFGSGATRLQGLDKVHGMHVLEAIAHNLKRSPGLVRQMAG
ncbi:IS5 family transposase [Flagellimonas pacifica]|uniref:Transposase, IS5 family n=1 Tax=Flagellimonas pacifica TaxID=1247520 RepID=A0A285MVJ9_9FLAO|nr:IS5 family transposase [Allomuricauda parva]SNZ01219.1 transposase, IS5 family [Allomuricauda parva]